MGSEIGYLAALSAGVVSFLSPCVLPLVPAYLSFIAGTSLDELVPGHKPDPELSRRVALSAVAFVAGFSTVFLILGASASALHALVFEHIGVLAKVAGALIVVFGLHYLGVFRAVGIFGFLHRDIRFHSGHPPVHWAGSYAVGVAFAFGWTPCIGPILATILALAGSSDSLGFGVSLLAAYSLGLGLPFLAAAMALPAFLRFSQGFRRHMRTVERVAGVVLVATGIAIYFDLLSAMGFYLLDAFPGLGTLG
ncbi:MAG: cytochrome c biogenesis protein CcdA [Proteobacteria bacterium]|nr:cytochrome c biogenesis protein CcdA [Pseudomonadota bacterium]